MKENYGTANKKSIYLEKNDINLLELLLTNDLVNVDERDRR